MYLRVVYFDKCNRDRGRCVHPGFQRATRQSAFLEIESLLIVFYILVTSSINIVIICNPSVELISGNTLVSSLVFDSNNHCIPHTRIYNGSGTRL